MNYLIYCVLLLLTLKRNSDALNILGIFPYEGKSHFFVFRVLLRELANRGHNLTVISYYPEKEPPKNYHDISLTLPEEKTPPPLRLSYSSIIGTGIYLATSGRENCETLLANKEVQFLINQKPKFDVVIVEQFNSDCGLGIAYKLDAPVIGVTAHILMPWHYNRFGIPYNPSFVPFHFLGGGTKPSLYQRIERAIFEIYFKSIYYFVSQNSNQKTLAKYFDDIPPLEDLARDIKFLLVYQNYILTGSTLFPANVIEVGGYHVAKAKPLTGELKKFVEDAEHGIIYISFGTILKSTSLSNEKVNDILETMEEFPQRFIWKWDNGTTLGLGKNKLFTSKWLPQVDILGHPKTLAFFSHCGNGGTTEAIHYGVPIVAMPILGDQPANAAAIEESGVGTQLDIGNLNKEYLMEAFKKVLNPRFREKAKHISKAWHDRPMSPLDTAVYWTEFVAKHSNFTFRTAAADVPTYQYMNLDIFCVFSIFFILILFLLRVFFIMCCKSKVRRSNKKPEENKISKSKRE